MLFPDRFDVIVVGGGHAGTEAALAGARMGRAHAAADAQHRDAGPDVAATRRSAASARATWSRRSTRWAARWRIATDEAGIQFRILNSQQGRRRCARRARRPTGVLYKQAIRTRLENQPNLTLFQQAVDDLTARRRRRRCAGHRRDHAARRALRGRRGGADDRHLPVRPDPRRAGALRGRAAPASRRPRRWARGCASSRCRPGA